MKKVLICLLLIGRVLTLPAQSAQTDSASVENALLDAVMYIQEGQAEAAYTILDSLKNISPSNDAVHYYMGLCRYSQGDFKNAIRHIKEASELDPSNNWYLETLANLYIYTGEPAEAGGLYRTLAERNPERFRNSLTLALMADSYRLKRDYKAFFETLTELVRDENTDEEQKYQAVTGAIGPAHLYLHTASDRHADAVLHPGRTAQRQCAPSQNGDSSDPRRQCHHHPGMPDPYGAPTR